jgi:hypothetical protein
MGITFEQWQSISDDTELKAAAAAAFVLGARVERLDIPPAQGMRDFDLLFDDGRREPLEITSYVDRPAHETWERIRRAAPLVAPSLMRRWVLTVPHSTSASDRTRGPYDVKDFMKRIEPALAALEGAGHHTINLGRLQRESALAGPFQTLVTLGIQRRSLACARAYLASDDLVLRARRRDHRREPDRVRDRVRSERHR